MRWTLPRPPSAPLRASSIDAGRMRSGNCRSVCSDMETPPIRPLPGQKAERNDNEQVANVAEPVDQTGGTEAQRPAQSHAVPERGGVCNRPDPRWQLSDRKERAAKEEQRDHAESEDKGERLIGL